jgi:TPR repeat protein
LEVYFLILCGVIILVFIVSENRTKEYEKVDDEKEEKEENNLQEINNFIDNYNVHRNFENENENENLQISNEKIDDIYKKSYEIRYEYPSEKNYLTVIELFQILSSYYKHPDSTFELALMYRDHIVKNIAGENYPDDFNDDSYERILNRAVEYDSGIALYYLAKYHIDFNTLTFQNDLGDDVWLYSGDYDDDVAEKGISWHKFHVTKNKLNYNEMAYKEFEVLATAGLLVAQEKLALMYHIGSGIFIMPDREKAMYWYKEAAKNGSIDAAKNLKYMEDNPKEGILEL